VITEGDTNIASPSASRPQTAAIESFHSADPQVTRLSQEGAGGELASETASETRRSGTENTKAGTPGIAGGAGNGDDDEDDDDDGMDDFEDDDDDDDDDYSEGGGQGVLPADLASETTRASRADSARAAACQGGLADEAHVPLKPPMLHHSGSGFEPASIRRLVDKLGAEKNWRSLEDLERLLTARGIMLHARLRQAEEHNLRVSSINGALRSLARATTQCLLKQADDAADLLSVFDELEAEGLGQTREEFADLVDDMLKSSAALKQKKGQRMAPPDTGGLLQAQLSGIGTTSLAEAAKVGGPPLLLLHPSAMQRVRQAKDNMAGVADADVSGKAVNGDGNTADLVHLDMEPVMSVSLVPADIMQRMRAGAATKVASSFAGVEGRGSHTVEREHDQPLQRRRSERVRATTAASVATS